VSVSMPLSVECRLAELNGGTHMREALFVGSSPVYPAREPSARTKRENQDWWVPRATFEARMLVAECNTGSCRPLVFS